MSHDCIVNLKAQIEDFTNHYQYQQNEFYKLDRKLSKMRQNDDSADAQMEKQIAAYRTVCTLMQELDTLNALAEWWEQILWKAKPGDEGYKECYYQMRLSAKNMTEQEF